MTISTSIRTTVRRLITDWGSDATLYSFTSATVTNNDEGEDTAITWGSGTAIKVISSNHHSLRKLMESMGLETNNSERVFLVRDDVTIAAKDKITIDSENYEITEIKKIDPIENTNIAYRIVTSKNEVY